MKRAPIDIIIVLTLDFSNIENMKDVLIGQHYIQMFFLQLHDYLRLITNLCEQSCSYLLKVKNSAF